MPVHPHILSDPDVELAQRSGGRLKIGQWSVLLPRRFGFCKGVFKALDQLQRALARRPAARVLLLGDIIHNDTVNNGLRADGVVILPESAVSTALSSLQDGDTVVIPAFGVPLELAARLQALQEAGRIHLADTTCGYIRRIWDFVESEALAGATVVILGKPDHPENHATLSRALAAGHAVVQLASLEMAHAFADLLMATGGAEDLARRAQAIPGLAIHHPGRLNLQRLAFAAQTTLLHSDVTTAEARLQQAAAALGAHFASAASVCNSTQERQEAALDLCRSGADLFLVVGGFASSNTAQLQRLAVQYASTYFIRSATDFSATQITHYDPGRQTIIASTGWLPAGPATIGILAGASCPSSDIGGVIRKLREISG